MTEFITKKGKAFGSACEELAVSFFNEHGYRIIERNFRSGNGEIDIIAEKDGYTIFIEVKARKSTKFGLPQEAVTSSKQATIKRVAQAFLQKRNLLGQKIRFDVLAITFTAGGSPRFEHIPFAF